MRNINDSGEAADKTCCKLQHVAMHVTCPQCHTTYQLKDDIHHAVLVCHRCQTEFTTDDQDTFEQHPQIAKETTTEIPLNSSHLAPKRRKARIWPWLTTVLLIIMGLGIQYNQDTWLQQTWVRNILIQLHYPLKMQANDWSMLRQQTHRQWITRQNGSKILMFTGVLRNNLSAPQRPPQLTIQFYDTANTAPTQSITLPFTLQPSLPQIHHAPYVMPAQDNTPIPAHSQRTFTLVLEHVPEQSREFSVDVSLK